MPNSDPSSPSIPLLARAAGALPLLLILFLGFAGRGGAATAWEPNGGARVAIVGNGMARRIADSGYLELALHAAFPERKLRVRSYATEGFHLERDGEATGAALKAFDPELIFLAVGLNESFDGAAGLAGFETALRLRAADWTRPRGKAGKGASIFLIPPVPYRQPGPGFPAEAPLHERMEPYVEAMGRVAVDLGPVLRLELWNSFADLADEAGGAVTADGVHLNRRGQWLLAMLISHQLRLPVPEGKGGGYAMISAIRQTVRHRERLWRSNGQRDGHLIRVMDDAIWEAPKPSLAEIWAWEPEDAEFIGGAEQRLAMPSVEDLGIDGVVPPEEAVATMVTHPDLTVSLWASERMAPLWNPVSLCFDPEGRLFVGCAPRGSEPYVLLLEDLDHDHSADRHAVFAQGEELHPGGLLADGNGLYLSTDQGFFHYGDPDHDGIAERIREVMPGHGKREDFAWGPGGGLWINELPGAGFLVETAWGVQQTGGGHLIRWNPRQGHLATRAGLEAGDTLGLQFDRWGRALVRERNEGHIAFLDEIGGLDGAGAGMTAPPGVGGAGAWLTGFYFPRPFQGAYLRGETAGDGSNGVSWYRPRPFGGVEVWEPGGADWLRSKDANFWAADLCTGPDGALYILDAHGKRRNRGGQWIGRIWRVGVRHAPPIWSPHAGTREEIEFLFERLREVDPLVRAGVRHSIWNREAGEVLPRLERWVKRLSHEDPDRQQILMEALWLYQAFGVANGSLLARVVESPQPLVRAGTAPLLAEWQAALPESSSLLQKLMEDEAPEVRLAALHAARRIGTAQAGDIARIARHHPMDPVLEQIYEATVARLGSQTGPPPSERAKAVATSNADLIAGEMTPHAAGVLLERSGVEMAGLLRAGVVASRRSQRNLSQWIVDRLEDHQSSTTLIRNLVLLLPKANGWELHRETYRLHDIADRTPREDVRRAAYAALTLAAASSRTMAALQSRVEQRGDLHVTEWLRGSETVLGHETVALRFKTSLRQELAVEDPPVSRPAARVRVVAPGARRLNFAELEVRTKEGNVARDKATSQSRGGLAPAWWSQLARNGVNGVDDIANEFPVKDSRPSSESVRGVMVGAPEDPWWEVDLGGTMEVTELVYWPGAASPGPSIPELRFELYDAEGRMTFSETRFLGAEVPLRIDVQMAPERVAAAARAARKMGDAFVNSLLNVARHSLLIDSRFSAIRALRRIGGLPPEIKFHAWEIAAGAEGFSRALFTSAPRDAVELAITNETGEDILLGLYTPDAGPEDPPVEDIGLIEKGQRRIARFLGPASPGTYVLRHRYAGVSPELRAILTVVAPKPPDP